MENGHGVDDMFEYQEGRSGEIDEVRSEFPAHFSYNNTMR